MSKTNNTDTFIGWIFYKIFRIRYLFYVTFSVIGIVAYFIDNEKLLYAMTAVCIMTYIIQMFSNGGFIAGIFFIPIGAFIGYYATGKNMNGFYLGILVVFVIRHIIRGLFFELISKLIKAGNK